MRATFKIMITSKITITNHGPQQNCHAPHVHRLRRIGALAMLHTLADEGECGDLILRGSRLKDSGSDTNFDKT